MIKDSPIVNAKKRAYSKSLYLYGFITLCYLIDKYEKEQKFEECEIIYKVIKDNNKSKKLDLPTKYNKQAIKYFADALIDHFGIITHYTISNLKFYVTEVESLVKSEIKKIK